jgi:hypothetical protein
MLSFPTSRALGGDPSSGALTTAEMVIVVVIIFVAAGLAALGMPMIGALEFIAGALCVACRSVRALRKSSSPPFTEAN